MKMTKLTYTVGNEEIATYETAKQRSAETGQPMTPKYTPIVEQSKTDPKRLTKIQAVFAKRRAEKMTVAESG